MRTVLVQLKCTYTCTTSPPPEFPPPKCCRSDSDLDNDPAFFVLFAGHDIIHRILTNPVPTPYQGAVAVPAAGTGGAAVSVSYRRFTQFLDRVGTKVGRILPRT